MKTRTLKTKIISILLILVMLLGMLPTQTFAMLGPITFPESQEVRYSYAERTRTNSGHENSSPTGTYHMLFNDYITFILRPNGMSSTLPTRTLDSSFKEYVYSTGWANLAHRVPVTERPRFYADTGASIKLKNKATGTPTISQVGVNKLQAVYKITSTDKPVTFTLTYEIVKVDVGKTDGAYGGGLIAPDPNDPGRAWAVKVSGTVEYAGTKLYSTNQSTGDDYGMASFTMLTEHLDFAKNRKSGDQGAIQLSKYSYPDDGPMQTSSFWNSGVYMPKMSTSTADGEITEFFTSSFGTDNQFVATSDYGGAWGGSADGDAVQISGPLGHASSYGTGSNYGGMIAYDPVEFYTKTNGTLLSAKKTLKVYSTSVMYKEYDTDGVADFTVDALWGYRDLYTENDSETPSDRTYYTKVKTGGHLGIIKESDGTVKAIEGQSTNALKAAYGDKLLAVFRGDWEREGTDYKFKGNVALSPSVTATARSSYSSFTVSEDGTVTMSLMGLSCPSFQFFTGDESGITFDYEGSSAGVLNLKIDPSKNNSILHLDIPGATSKMEGAKIGIDGSLVFSGTMGIATPVLDIVDLQLNRVGMGYDKKSNYKVNGIEASGSVGMPDVIGFPIPSNRATAEINTFGGEERYHFEVEIEIPNLFESEASLTLTRLKNGALVPDDLELMVGAGVGVPLVPPVVVAEINGIGGGFSDLAKSINGDFYAVPPAKLSLSARAEVLQMLSGKATMTVGLGYYEQKLSDPEFFDLFGLDAEYKESTYFTVDERTGWGLTFTGIAVGGSKSLEVHLPNEDVDVISIDSGLSIDAFAGVANQNKKSYVMLDINGDGKIDGSLKFPKKIGKLKMPKKIAGKTIASTKLELALGLKTMFNLNKDIEDIVWDGVKNASVNATVSYSKKIFGCKLYVTAVFAKKNLKIGVDTWLGDIDTSFSWGKAKNARLMSYGETEDMYYAMYLSSDVELLGSTQGMQLMSINMEDELVNQLADAGLTLTQNGDGENNYTITVSDSAKTEQLLFSLTPKAEASDEQLESMFTITKDGAEYQLAFDEGEESDSLDDADDAIASSANAYVTAGGYDEATGEEVSGGIVVKLPDAGTYTISAADAFDIEVLGFELAEYIDTDGTLKELKNDKDYVVRIYLMDSEGEYHMIGEETTADNTTNISDITISNTQDSVPSGTYRKVYRLLEKLPAEESGDYYVTLDTYEGGEIEVTNPNEVPAPTGVEAKSVGSEILRASWTAPADSDNIDGYAVTIYEKNGDQWVSTGSGYEVRADESGNIPTSVNMALTIGGSGDLDGDGVVDDENASLEADKTYRISVASLSDVSADLDGDGENETASRRSIEAYSGEEGVFIPKATPPTLTYLPEPEVLEGANIKTLYVMPGDEIVITSSETAAMSAIRMDDNSTLASGTGTELIVAVPEFEGNLIIQIDAMAEDGDRVRDYISLRKDTVAPVITVDSESFFADENGNFTITGITEAGADIIVDNDREDIECTHEYTEEEGYFRKDNYTISREADGSFTLTGKLAEKTRGDEVSAGGALIAMRATDSAGNESAFIYASVVYEDEIPTVTVTFDANGGTGTMESVETTEVEYSLPENGFIAPAGYQFKGWASAADGAVIEEETIAVLEDSILYAIWEPQTLTGTVTITGDMKVGSTLTATVTDTNNTGELSYQWWRAVENNTAIAGATSSTYTLTDEDIKHLVYCVVSSSVQTGSIQEYGSGTVIQAYICGDVNADGAVNASDALVVLKYAAKIDVSAETFVKEAAHTNSDTSIDARDALNILKLAAKIIDSLPVE